MSNPLTDLAAAINAHQSTAHTTEQQAMHEAMNNLAAAINNEGK